MWFVALNLCHCLSRMQGNDELRQTEELAVSKSLDVTRRGIHSKDTVFSTWCTSALTFAVCVAILNKEHSNVPMLRTKELFFSFLYSRLSDFAVQWTVICGFLCLYSYFPSEKGNCCFTDYSLVTICTAVDGEQHSWHQRATTHHFLL